MHPTYFKTLSVGYMVWTLNRKYDRANDKNFQSQSRDKINQHQENSIDEFLTKKRNFCSKAETKYLRNLSIEKVNLIELKEIPFDEFLTELEIEQIC